jgi:ABC-type transporter MlaC component
MTTRIAACLFAISFAGAVAAQEATPDTWMKTAASKSREQVKAELAQARQDGSMHAFALDYDFASNVASVKSRQQVHAELIAARESGEFELINAEVAPLHRLPMATRVATRAR